MSYFGSNKKVFAEYVKPKINLLEEFKQVFEGYVPKEDALVPLIMWFSNSITNIIKVQAINRNFFWVNRDVLRRGLYLAVDKNFKFIKYPKKKKDDEEELGFLIPYIQQYYGWSDKEFKFHRYLFDLEDPELHQTLDSRFTFDSKICRKLGIKRNKIKAKFEKISRTKGFF